MERSAQHEPDFEEPVEVVPYDPAWPHLSAAEAGALREVFGSRVIAIEHFGSTAVPGLAGKPVVDLLIGVAQLMVSAAELEGMTRLGYEAMGAGAVPGRLHFRKRLGHGRNVNANLAVYDGELWRDNLLFRDYLRRHPAEAQRYAALKHEQAAGHRTSLIRYAAGKAAIISELLQRAREEAQQEATE